jgi:hypothetical protein
VYRAKHKTSGMEVAIKYIESIDKSEQMARKVLREVIILRKLTEFKENIFTTKLIDIILPIGVMQVIPETDEKTHETSPKEVFDLNKMTHLFIVMEIEQTDLR